MNFKGGLYSVQTHGCVIIIFTINQNYGLTKSDHFLDAMTTVQFDPLFVIIRIWIRSSRILKGSE